MVVSDANSVYIEAILEHHGLKQHFKEVITHPHKLFLYTKKCCATHKGVTVQHCASASPQCHLRVGLHDQGFVVVFLLRVQRGMPARVHTVNEFILRG